MVALADLSPLLAQTLWSNVDPSKSGQDLDTWLSRLFEGVLLISKSELSWAASWLPDCATQLVQHLLISFFSSAEGNLRKALATAVNKGEQGYHDCTAAISSLL